MAIIELVDAEAIYAPKTETKKEKKSKEADAE
jgi:hypothetical protein